MADLAGHGLNIEADESVNLKRQLRPFAGFEALGLRDLPNLDVDLVALVLAMASRETCTGESLAARLEVEAGAGEGNRTLV